MSIKKTIFNRLGLGVLIMLSSFGSAQAQQARATVERNPVDNTPSSISFSDGVAVKASDAQNIFKT
jgi:hypothetical protein